MNRAGRTVAALLGASLAAGGAAWYSGAIPFLNTPSRAELSAAIMERFPAIEVTGLTILKQQYFCPADCDADYFRNEFEGTARIAQDTYDSLSPSRWMPECGLTGDDAPLAPIHTFANGKTAPLLVFFSNENAGTELTFKGEGSTKERPDGSWRMGGAGIAFFDLSGKDMGFPVNDLVLEQLDGRPVLGSPEFEALCDRMRAKKGG